VSQVLHTGGAGRRSLVAHGRSARSWIGDRCNAGGRGGGKPAEQEAMIDKEARMADGARGGGTLIYSHGAELQAVAKICLGLVQLAKTGEKRHGSTFVFI